MEQACVPALAPLKRWERLGLLLLLAGCVAFGVLVEIRSVFLTRRMGDFGCYARGAWAVRTGADLYDVTCDNDWHYNYPPLLAILMVPLADPPRGEDTAGMTPYAVSVAVWYVFSLLCLMVAVHALARALEEKSADPELRHQPHGCRRWWALRCWPILICLAPIGCTLMRGQVNTLVLALLCGLLAGLIRGANFRAGLCLAGAACIKVYPIFLLVYPLWQRNGRCLGGCLAGLFIGLVAIPVAALGPERTLAVYDKYATVLLGPALGRGSDDTRVEELLGVNATWSQAFKVVAHKTIYPDFATRPLHIAPWLHIAHLAVGAALTLLVLLVGRRAQSSATGIVFTVGSLFLLMILLCPICHLHYFTFAVPLIMALVVQRWENQTIIFPGLALTSLFSVFFIANALPQFDEFPELRDFGLAMYAGLLLMGAALWQASRGHKPAPVIEALPARLAA
jgi:alpha-1,2-mannosyltransferase